MLIYAITLYIVLVLDFLLSFTQYIDKHCFLAYNIS
nr:MAG TPA: hypothetical protein [Caudoviricetes sp.]